MQKPKLTLNFRGRIIDHLGIQMYQSPIASVAEMISNAWDADAVEVKIDLPLTISDDSFLVIADDGVGMTLEECQDKYLSVGQDRRKGDPNAVSPIKGRPILGRKGIGKFAGFGIAQVIRVDTTSGKTGERTVFDLDLAKIRGENGDNYVDNESLDVNILRYEEPDEARIANHGTRIILQQLSLKRGLSAEVYARSLARRFLLHQRVADFKVYVNEVAIPEEDDLAGVEFSFPRDYELEQRPTSLVDIDAGGWGIENLESGDTIKWQFVFYEYPILDEELRGIAIFAKLKLAQTPFTFNLVGGLGGQQGLEYLSGRIEADFIDSLESDIIATERQRLNWEHERTLPLAEWGKRRIQQLLRLWQERRSFERLQLLTEKVSVFGSRLERLPSYERKIIDTSLRKLAVIPQLSDPQFRDMGHAVLTAWEGGRLRDLISSIADTENMSEGKFLGILLEANVLTALHTAETVKVKLDTVRGLEDLITKGELELAVRDYIAEHPWLLSPRWETFRVERGIQGLLVDIRSRLEFDDPVKWGGRVDLVLGSGDQLLLVEFMKPGLKLDFDHVLRYKRYVFTVRNYLNTNTGQQYHSITGYIVADNLDKEPGLQGEIEAMQLSDMYALDWANLLRVAKSQWKDFLDVLAERAPNDERLQNLLQLDVQRTRPESSTSLLA